MTVENSMFDRLTGAEVLIGKKKEQNASFEKFLSRAEKTIHIVSGEMPEDFYGTKKVVIIIKRLIKKNGLIEVVTSNNPSPESIEKWKSAGAAIYKGKKRRVSHFTIIDKKHIAMQEPHPPNTEIREWKYFYNSDIAPDKIVRFNKLKFGLKPE